ncbi:MAG TPA: DUF4783 domain-containing protein [Bacteroidia bacterium]|nr:DUF4783 domain-containing protein [Bacteroidia bacterium]
MKKHLLTLVIGISVFSILMADISTDINSSMKSGNFKTIASYFNASVELNIPGADGLYSKAQAELLLKEFFAKNTPRNYTVKHDGVSQDGSKYSIGALETSSGVYRTYYYLKNNNGAFLIKELRIEKDK